MNPNVSQHYRSSTPQDLYDAKYYASLAEAWANEDENVVVLNGEYSAKHYAIKAEKAADVLENMTASAKSVSSQQEAKAVWDKTTGNMSFEIPSGVDGADGADGPEGKSDNGLSYPTVTSGQPITIDISAGFIFVFTLKDPMTEIIVNKTDSLTDRGTQFTLMIKQGVGSNKINIKTQDGSPVRWPNNLAPQLSYEKGLTDTITLLTVDGGSSYFAYLSGAGFPE